jgi:hypothetical protein
MSVTRSSDFVFEPKVWQDHIEAYFDKKLVYGAFALRNDTLKAEGTGLTINFPYYKAVGEAQEPTEDESLIPEKLEDDSFLATVFEVGKAIGIKKKAFKASADSVAGIISETQRQLGRVMAEKVDEKLNSEITNPVNYTVGFQASAAGDTMNVRKLLRSKVVAFGDKHEDALVCFMHSLQFLDLMEDDKTGFLKADANDPFMGIKGFAGRLFGMGIVVVDTVPQAADVGGKQTRVATFHKMNSYGIMNKQEMELDEDKDILARERLYTANQWYAVKSFHAKVSADDKKAGACITTIS